MHRLGLPRPHLRLAPQLRAGQVGAAQLRVPAVRAPALRRPLGSGGAARAQVLLCTAVVGAACSWGAAASVQRWASRTAATLPWAASRGPNAPLNPLADIGELTRNLKASVRWPTFGGWGGQERRNWASRVLTALYVGMWALLQFPDLQPLWERHALVSAANLRASRLWCLPLACISHLTIIHLAMNLLSMQMVLENQSLGGVLGTGEALGLHFGIAMLSSLVQLAVTPRKRQLGASAAVFGFFAMLPAIRNSNEAFYGVAFIPGQSFTTAQIAVLGLAVNVAGAVYALAAPGGGTGIAWVAHIAGAGLGAAYTYWRRKRGDPRFQPWDESPTNICTDALRSATYRAVDLGHLVEVKYAKFLYQGTDPANAFDWKKYKARYDAAVEARRAHNARWRRRAG